MKKIVINTCYGGFGLSKKAIKMYGKLKGLNLKRKKTKYGRKDYYINGRDFFLDSDIKRDDPSLIEVVTKLGEKADGDFSELKIVEIPNDIQYIIQDYDGIEWIAEKHRVWG